MSAPKGDARLAAFLDEISDSGKAQDVVAIFHAVRNLPYLSTGDRSLEGILTRRAGSCSSKHILLAALLNHVGIKAHVELVLGDFATPFRNARNIPDALATYARDGIRDIHNIVCAEVGGASVMLDATWHDAMQPFNLRVNTAWHGKGSTPIAVDVTEMLGPSPQPAEDKARIISSWPEVEQQRRRRFLETVNEWVTSVTPKNQWEEEHGR